MTNSSAADFDFQSTSSLGSENDRSLHPPMGSSFRRQSPTFVEHILAATVADSVKEEIIDDLLHLLNRATALPGVVATHVGRCVPVVGEHTFLLHIRAIDSASCDAACKAAYEACTGHLNLHNINSVEDFNFKDILVVDYESQPIGSWGEKWPAIRIAVYKFKPDTPKSRITKLENVLSVLPTLFPLVKQVTWGRNFAKEKCYRENYGYADVDQDFGTILGFSSCEDMYKLGADPKYWELLNFVGISTLEKYQVVEHK